MSHKKKGKKKDKKIMERFHESTVFSDLKLSLFSSSFSSSSFSSSFSSSSSSPPPPSPPPSPPSPSSPPPPTSPPSTSPSSPPPPSPPPPPSHSPPPPPLHSPPSKEFPLSWSPPVPAIAILTLDQYGKTVVFERSKPTVAQRKKTVALEDESSKFRCHLDHTHVYKMGPSTQIWMVDHSSISSTSKAAFTSGFAVCFKSEEASNSLFTAFHAWKSTEDKFANGAIEPLKTASTSGKSSAKLYFHCYGQLLRQQNMLQDYVRTAILANPDFQGRVVVDVGAGGGILSLFASQAGAKHIYSTEASGMSEQAKPIADNPGLSSAITVFRGKVEEVETPEKSDMSISAHMVGPGMLQQGSIWTSLEELKMEVKNHAISHHVELRVLKADKKRYTVKCSSENCKWRLHASIIEGGPQCAIKKLNGIHCCAGIVRTGNKEACTRGLAKHTIDRFRDQPSLKPKDLIRDIHREKGVTISYGLAWRAKEAAHSAIHGDHTEAYKKLEGYCEEILKTNPGSIAFVQRTSEGRFSRCFIAFNASLKGFSYCRPVVGLDGTHLKGRYLGTLLSATAIDGNDGLFPLAFAVVAAENDDNWVWYLQCLKDCLHHSERVTFISERQKGLVEGVESVFGSGTPHAYCMWRLSENFRQAFKSTQLAHLLWNAAHANNVEDYDDIMKEMHAANPQATTWILAAANPIYWANSKFIGQRYGHMTCNIAESLNSSLRELPVLAMLEMIRHKLMAWFSERREEAHSLVIDAREQAYLRLTSRIEEDVRKACELGRSYRIIAKSDLEFEVLSTKPHVVHLGSKTCSCCRWQQAGVPCSHAACAILCRNESVHSYVHGAFFLTSYYETYKEEMHPFTIPTTLSDILPPATRRSPGRPKSKRIHIEEVSKEVHHCTGCKGTGHNARTCRAPMFLDG